MQTVGTVLLLASVAMGGKEPLQRRTTNAPAVRVTPLGGIGGAAIAGAALRIESW